MREDPNNFDKWGDQEDIKIRNSGNNLFLFQCHTRPRTTVTADHGNVVAVLKVYLFCSFQKNALLIL